MLRESLVQERVIALDQFEHAAVLVNDVVQIQLGFPFHRLSQLTIKPESLASVSILQTSVSGEHRASIYLHGLDVARLQPLPAKVLNQGFRTRIHQHPFDLRGQITPQPPSPGESKQFVIWHRRPEKI